MPQHRKLTEEERRQIVDARAEGASAADLAQRFHVSRRTIYDTLRRAESGESQRSAGSRAISFRISEQMLADFDAALARRGISDRPAALRSLIRSADKVLMAPDPELCRALAAWSAALKLHGDAINRVAKQLNEAKLRGEPLPPVAQLQPVLRGLARCAVNLVDDVNARWRARTNAMVREVDKALCDHRFEAAGQKFAGPGTRPDRASAAVTPQIENDP